MTVKQLIEKLESFPPDAKVIIYEDACWMKEVEQVSIYKIPPWSSPPVFDIYEGNILIE